MRASTMLALPTSGSHSENASVTTVIYSDTQSGRVNRPNLLQSTSSHLTAGIRWALGIDILKQYNAFRTSCAANQILPTLKVIGLLWK